jgi:tetratricopeptide (TPR) repeat protein
MHIRSVVTIASTVTALALGVPALARVQAPPAQTPQQPQPKISDAEASAFKAIGTAPDAAAMMQAAAAFMQKYPKSTLVHQIAVNLSAKIGGVTDMTQQLALAQTFRTTFPGAAETDLILLNIVDADLKLNKLDEAFKEASDFLSRHPNDLSALMNMTFVGAEQAKRHNLKYVAESEKDGLKAIAIIEGDQRPANLGDPQWAQYKTKYLAQLYQSVGVCSMVNGKSDEAAARFAKSVAINPRDAMTYMWMGAMADQEYEALVAKYKATAAGPAQDDALKTALAALDRVIDDYAHVVALSEGDAAYKPMHDTILEDLTGFYKYRHKGTDGLQALIDKYKVIGGGLN